jgi:hypothetical protein
VILRYFRNITRRHEGPKKDKQRPNGRNVLTQSRRDSKEKKPLGFIGHLLFSRSFLCDLVVKHSVPASTVGRHSD